MSDEKYIPKSLRPLPMTSRPVRYGIGIRTSEDAIGMKAGPYDAEIACLDIVGDDGDVIVIFNADGTDDIIWTWSDSQMCWLKRREPKV